MFAYGQTGSGKTHTMEGPPSDPGINFRAMKELFRVITAERRASHKHDINASIVEIYNEQVRPCVPQCRVYAVVYGMPKLQPIFLKFVMQSVACFVGSNVCMSPAMLCCVRRVCRTFSE